MINGVVIAVMTSLFSGAALAQDPPMLHLARELGLAELRRGG